MIDEFEKLLDEIKNTKGETEDNKSPDIHKVDLSASLVPPSRQTELGKYRTALARKKEGRKAQRVKANLKSYQEITNSLNADMQVDNGEHILRRQAMALDAIFHFALQNAIGVEGNDKPSPQFENRENLHLALQSQRQCESTLKAMTTINYMDTLRQLTVNNLQNSAPLRPYPQAPSRKNGQDTPHPLFSHEQTRLGESDN